MTCCLKSSLTSAKQADERLDNDTSMYSLLGGIVLHQGKIAEMRTGEGKTLTATSPVALNALTQEGVHVITVNDYLAKSRHAMDGTGL